MVSATIKVINFLTCQKKQFFMKPKRFYQIAFIIEGIINFECVKGIKVIFYDYFQLRFSPQCS